MNPKNQLALEALYEIRDNRMLDQDTCYKCLVELAYTSFREGEITDCLELLGRVTPEYYQNKQLDHMKEDEFYRDSVIYLACKLIQMGMVEVGYDVPATQNKGNA